MTVSLTIDDAPVQAGPDMTVLQAAQANDIYIPTLCDTPKLRPAGACRMCLVEIEKMRGFPSACTTPVSDGMVVRTKTETVLNLRREILYLLLSEHPYTCLVCKEKCGDFHGGTIRKAAVTTGCQYCPSNGQCKLQDLIDYLDITDVPYPITYRGMPVEQDDPFFDRDYNLCILCGRCVRTCQEMRHNGVLAFTDRGNEAIVGTAFGRSHLETGCQFCGACVDVCPTGSLADKRGKWEGTPSAVIPSVCPYCSVGCTTDVQVKDAKVIRMLGREDSPPNDGQLCVRGRFGVVEVVHNLARLKSPLVRRNGRLVEVSWDEALDVVAQNLVGYQGDQFALLSSAAATNETSYMLQKFARTAMNSNNVALTAGFPESKNNEALINTLKMINGPAIHDLRNAACILTVGTNAFQSHPILGLEIRHALSQGARLITLDTRQTYMAKRADVWLQPKVGTDHVLLAGIINAKAGGSTEFAEAVDLDRVAAITGVKKEDIVAAAEELAKSPLIIVYGSGVTHHPTAPEVIKAIHNLASLLGGGVIGIPGEGNFVGAHDMGVHPALLPGYHPLSDPEARAAFENAWDVSLDATPGRSYEAIVDGVRQGQIKALYLAGEIPPWPELESLDFLVVQDILTTENMQYADVVLPTTTFAEMDGSLTNLEGRVQVVRQAIQPVGTARPGCMIARDIARQMSKLENGRSTGRWDYTSPVEVMAEIANLTPAYAEVHSKESSESGVLRRFESSVEAKVSPFSLNGIPQLSNDEFPLILISERNLHYYHGASLTKQVKGMNLIKPEEVLYLNPADAASLGIAGGDPVKIVSPYGSDECLAEISRDLPEGAAFASFNRVAGSPLFPTLAPTNKACAIRIEVAA